VLAAWTVPSLIGGIPAMWYGSASREFDWKYLFDALDANVLLVLLHIIS
jgi:hypothetical protein